MTTGVNPTLSLAEDLFRNLVWDPLVTAGLLALDTQVPVLAIWPLKNIIDGTVNAFSGYIFGQVRLIIDVTAIQLLNESHKEAYAAASEKLHIIAHDQGVDSDAFRQARASAKVTLSQFVNFNK